MRARPILEAVGLERRFRIRSGWLGREAEVRAVDKVDLSILEGETFAIVGESGCGKSTLARLLVRLIEPSGGSVRYDGGEIADLDERTLRRLRRELQFVFQDPFASLNPRMSVGALIEEPLRVHGIGTAEERRAEVARLLTRVGLQPHLADRYPHEFSGGQRQRIGIARALATRPRVLVGDEPVSALDVSIQAQVINILEALKAELGLTLIVIAHDLSVIRHMSDRVAVMYLGQIVETAPVEALFETPLHPYTEALLAAIPLPRVGARRAAVRAEGELPNPIDPPTGCPFHPRCTYALPVCVKTRPPLEKKAGGRVVACHRTDELRLAGLAGQPDAGSPAAERRFALYRAAAAPTTEKEGRGDPR